MIIARSCLRAAVFIVACIAIAASGSRGVQAQTADVPYVPTPMNVVEAMLDIAKVGSDDFVIDLGSGDGRIVITAARKYGARGLGVELDGALVNDARREAQRQGVAARVQFRAENLFVTDLKEATVVTTYLYPRINMELRPRIFTEMKPGSRLVSHEFDFGNWKPDAQTKIKVPNKPYGPPLSEVFLWIVPANAAGRWQWRTAVEGLPLEFEVVLEQTFQELRGSARVSGKPARLENPRMRGEEIRFTVIADVNGRGLPQEFFGRVSADAIRGKTRVPNAESGVDWEATRVERGKINTEAVASPPAVVASPSRDTSAFR